MNKFPLKWNARTFLIANYSLAMMIPNILLLAFDPNGLTLVKLAICVVMISAWHAVFKSTRKAVLYSLPIFLLLPGDVFFSLLYHEPPTTPVVVAITETNLTEAFDFLKGRGILLFALIIWSLTSWWLAYRALRQQENSIYLLSHQKVKTLSMLTMGSFAALLTLFLFAPLWANIGRHVPLLQSVHINSADEFIAEKFAKLKTVFPFGRLVSISEYAREIFNIDNINHKKNKHRFGAIQLTEHADLADREIYLLIIGETARSDQWPINIGPERPEIQSHLRRLKGIFKIPEIISTASYTHLSVPVMLSPTPSAQGIDSSQGKSVISVFKEAGFKTYWISNQPIFGGVETKITYIAKEANEAFFLNSSSNAAIGNSSFDQVILQPLERLLARPEKKQFFVIHLLGSHDAYQRRYPANFDILQPSLLSLSDPDHHDVKNKLETINSYANSMMYTDFVMSEIIHLVDAQSALSAMLYSSDHGESLFDGQCQLSGHGSANKVNFSVAAVGWLSSQYQAAFPDIGPRITSNSTNKLTTEHLGPTILNLAGITFPTLNLDWSTASPSFMLHRRIVNVATTSLDFDLASTRGDCSALFAP